MNEVLKYSHKITLFPYNVDAEPRKDIEIICDRKLFMNEIREILDKHIDWTTYKTFAVERILQLTIKE